MLGMRTVATPSMAAGEVLIRVEAAGVNRPDVVPHVRTRRAKPRASTLESVDQVIRLIACFARKAVASRAEVESLISYARARARVRPPLIAANAASATC